MNIIGIAGKMGSGKTTLARLIGHELQKRNFTVKQLSFATYLREYMHQRGIVVTRGNMQTAGDERRAKDPDVLINELSRDFFSDFCSSASNVNPVGIIDDARRYNEICFVRKHGLLIFLDEDTEVRQKRMIARGDSEAVINNVKLANHISETETENARFGNLTVKLPEILGPESAKLTASYIADLMELYSKNECFKTIAK